MGNEVDNNVGIIVTGIKHILVQILNQNIAEKSQLTEFSFGSA